MKTALLSLLFLFVGLSACYAKPKPTFRIFPSNELLNSQFGIITGEIGYDKLQKGPIDFTVWLADYNELTQKNYILYVQGFRDDIVTLIPADNKAKVEDKIYQDLTNKETASTYWLDRYLTTHVDGVHYSDVKKIEPELRFLREIERLNDQDGVSRTDIIVECDSYIAEYPEGYFLKRIKQLRAYHYSRTYAGDVNFYLGPENVNTNYMFNPWFKPFSFILKHALKYATNEDKNILLFILTTEIKKDASMVKLFKQETTYTYLNKNYICLLATSDTPDNKADLERLTKATIKPDTRLLFLTKDGTVKGELDNTPFVNNTLIDAIKKL